MGRFGQLFSTLLILLSVFIAAVSSAENGATDFALQVIPKSTLPPSTNFTVFRPSQSPHRNIYLLRASGEFNASILLPPPRQRRRPSLLRNRNSSSNNNIKESSSFEHEHTGSIDTIDYQLETTSQQARQHHCCWASNGGPYNPDASPVGTVIIDNHLLHGSFSSADLGFGQTRHGEWIIGAMASAKQVEKLGVTYFVTGLGGWLVYDGTNVVDVADDDNERAPRTAIGVDRDGRLVLLVADGAEHWLWNKGLLRRNLADILISQQVRYAINLDGGGSSVLTKKGQIISQPTCIDLPILCERAVSTVICISCQGNSQGAKEDAVWYPQDGRLPIADRFLYNLE